MGKIIVTWLDNENTTVSSSETWLLVANYTMVKIYYLMDSCIWFYYSQFRIDFWFECISLLFSLQLRFGQTFWGWLKFAWLLLPAIKSQNLFGGWPTKTWCSRTQTADDDSLGLWWRSPWWHFASHQVAKVAKWLTHQVTNWMTNWLTD